MWKCSKCSVENEDYFEACRNCSNIAPAPMKPVISENQSDEPRLGRISIIIGLVALSQYISVWLYAPKSLSGGIMLLLSINAAIALGCVSALLILKGLFSGERPLWIHIIGLLLNASPILHWFLLNYIQSRRPLVGHDSFIVSLLFFVS